MRHAQPHQANQLTTVRTVKNGFNLHVNSSLRCHISILSHFTIPAVRSQNVTNKSCLVCVKSEKYAFWVTLRLTGSMRQGESEQNTLHY